MRYKIFTDGGARGNPGPAGAGVQVIKVPTDGVEKKDSEQQSVIYEQASYLGRATNNEAEYRAFLAALEWLKDHLENERGVELKRVDFYLDSKLVVEQVNKNWKLKSVRMRKFAEQAWEFMAKLKKQQELELVLQHVVREKNKGADSLVNRALDVV